MTQRVRRSKDTVPGPLDRQLAACAAVDKIPKNAKNPFRQNKNLSRPPPQGLNQTQSYSHHNATLSMSPSPTVGFGDAGAGGIGAAAAAWAA